ncbi:MAG TPA: hypothetical protein VF092_07885 [Longimicrobium sp.]
MPKLRLDVDSLRVVSWTAAPEVREAERDTRSWGCTLLSCVAGACAFPAEH